MRKINWGYVFAGFILGFLLVFLATSVFSAGLLPEGVEIFQLPDEGLTCVVWSDGSGDCYCPCEIGGECETKTVTPTPGPGPDPTPTQIPPTPVEPTPTPENEAKANCGLGNGPEGADPNENACGKKTGEENE